jgi:hypothetical protein
MDISTKKQVEWGVYCENFDMIGLTVDAGDHFKNRAAIPLAPCSSLSSFDHDTDQRQHLSLLPHW